MTANRYVCDCGAVYSHPDQLIACANNRHGLGLDPAPEPAWRKRRAKAARHARLMRNRPELREALYGQLCWICRALPVQHHCKGECEARRQALAATFKAKLAEITPGARALFDEAARTFDPDDLPDDD